MPTYEYCCRACGHEFELEQRITEEPAKDCPKCGEPEARRLVGSGNFILKGGGWYADLYSSVPKDGKKPDAATSESKPEAKPDEKPDTRSDAKAKTPAD